MFVHFRHLSPGRKSTSSNPTTNTPTHEWTLWCHVVIRSHIPPLIFRCDNILSPLSIRFQQWCEFSFVIFTLQNSNNYRYASWHKRGLLFQSVSMHSPESDVHRVELFTHQGALMSVQLTPLPTQMGACRHSRGIFGVFPLPITDVAFSSLLCSQVSSLTPKGGGDVNRTCHNSNSGSIWSDRVLFPSLPLVEKK